MASPRLLEHLLRGEEQPVLRLREVVRHRLEPIRARAAWSTSPDSLAGGLTDELRPANVCSMPRDTTRRVPANEARRQARIALGKDPDDLSDVYRGRPTRPKAKPTEPPPNPYVPAAPLRLADAVSQLGIRRVQLAQAVREGKVATVRGRGRELMIAHDELERVRREGVVM